jgi:hypothetical protein
MHGGIAGYAGKKRLTKRLAMFADTLSNEPTTTYLAKPIEARTASVASIRE